MTRVLTDMEKSWLEDLELTKKKFLEAETDQLALHYVNESISRWSEIRGFYLAKLGQKEGDGK
jgi:hypothetical protein